MVLLIIIPTKNGYFIGNIPHFQTYPHVPYMSPLSCCRLISDNAGILLVEVTVTNGKIPDGFKMLQQEHEVPPGAMSVARRNWINFSRRESCYSQIFQVFDCLKLGYLGYHPVVHGCWSRSPNWIWKRNFKGNHLGCTLCLKGDFTRTCPGMSWVCSIYRSLTFQLPVR